VILSEIQPGILPFQAETLMMRCGGRETGMMERIPQPGRKPAVLWWTQPGWVAKETDGSRDVSPAPYL